MIQKRAAKALLSGLTLEVAYPLSLRWIVAAVGSDFLAIAASTMARALASSASVRRTRNV
jgi:hypothetical protein